MPKSRNTRQKEILEKIIKEKTGFFTAEDVLKESKKLDSTMGIATVYRYLKDIKKKNKIYSYQCDRRSLYSKEKKNHCHFICEKTGKVIHFELDNLDFLKNIRKQLPGTITSFQLEIKGICESCQK